LQYSWHQAVELKALSWAMGVIRNIGEMAALISYLTSADFV